MLLILFCICYFVYTLAILKYWCNNFNHQKERDRRKNLGLIRSDSPVRLSVRPNPSRQATRDPKRVQSQQAIPHLQAPPGT